MSRAALLAAVTAACLSAPNVSAATLRAGRDAPTLQQTIALSVPGDVVEVPEGNWRGPVLVDKAITLRGGGGVLDGAGAGTVLRVSAPGAVVEKLKVVASGSDLAASDSCIYLDPEATAAIVRNNLIEDCAFGIWVHRTKQAVIADNRVVGRSNIRVTDRGNGIQLFDGSELVVRGNEVTGARDGIYVSATDDSLIEHNRTSGQRYGVHYMFSNRNVLRNNVSIHNLSGFALMESRKLTVTDNTSSNNERHGILFRDAQHCEIRNNIIESNGQGLFFFSSTDNVIGDNRVAHNAIGAKIWAGSYRNRVTGNAFIGNQRQIFYVGESDMVWGETESGNYWSDYIGWDQDGDGLGDRPYRMDGFASNLTYRYPAAALLLHSPSLELLTHLEARMPVLRAATVIDRKPRMRVTRRE